jgi:hypothetical protein
MGRRMIRYASGLKIFSIADETDKLMSTPANIFFETRNLRG